MIDYSFLDPRLLFPNISEGLALTIESITLTLTLIGLIMAVIAEWKLFGKMGERPWKSLIPYYNSYIVYKHTWRTAPFWIYFSMSTLYTILKNVSNYLSENNPESMWMTLLLLIALPFGIASTVYHILHVFRLSEAFGKGKIFSIGLVLAYPIFIWILGKGKSQYIRECNADQTKSDAESPEIEGEVS